MAIDLLEPTSANLLLSAAVESTGPAPAAEETLVDEQAGHRRRVRIRSTGSEPAWLRPAMARLEYLLSLPENWDSYQAARIDPRAVGNAIRLLAATRRPGAFPTAIVPTVRGGVQLEWHVRNVDLEVEVPAVGALHVAYENHDTGRAWELDLRFDFTALVDALAEIAGLRRAAQDPAQAGRAEDDPLAAARERGRRAMTRMLESEGGTLSAAEVAARLGIPTDEVDARRRAGGLLAVDVGGDQRYPAWQLVDDRLLEGFEEILAELREHSPWDQMIFFLYRNVYADGMTPLAALRCGRIGAARRAAQAHGEHGAA
jgi:hypothetical protein